MKAKNRLFILILMASWSSIKAQKGIINITNYPDTIYFSDTLMIEVLTYVRDNGNPCSPLTSVKDTLNFDSLNFDLTYDFTGPWHTFGCAKRDTLYYQSLPHLDSIILTCYMTIIDSNQLPPMMSSRFDTASVVIHIANSTSLKEFKDKNAFHIYPNPSNGSVELNFEKEMHGDYNLNIYDLLGHVVHNEQVMLNGNSSKRIDFNHLNKGIYLVSIENETDKLSKKLVLK